MPEQSRCHITVEWWDLGTVHRCVRAAGHPGPHRDGVRWFDAAGFQVTGDPDRAAR